MTKRSKILDASEFNQRLFADQVDTLFKHTVVGTAATLFNAIVLVFVFRSYVEHLNLVLWLVCACIVSASRLIVNWCYQKSAQRKSNLYKWYAGFNLTLFLSGVVWGAAAVVIFPSHSLGHQAFIAFVTGGMVAGAIGAFTAILTPFFIFSFPALLPLCIRFFLIGDEIHIAMGTMVLLFLVLISLTASRMHQNTIDLLALKYEKSTLIDNLQEEIYQRERAQESLRQQKERVEEMVAQRTAQLQRANLRLRAVLNYAPLMIWAIDRRGVLTFAEGKGFEKIGLAPDDALDRPIRELFNNNQSLGALSNRVLSGEFVSDTYDIDHNSFEMRYQPIMNADGQVAGAIGVAIDVTEQTAAKKALQKSEEKYRELVENINDVIFVIDRECRILYVSPVIESVLGYPADDLTGRCFTDYIHQDDMTHVKYDFNIALQGVSGPKEYRFITNHGETRWCRVSSRPIAENSDTVGIQGVLVDITRPKMLEEQLQRAQKMEALGIMAGGVAHDLNNILSGIISYPELLLMDLPQDSPYRRPLITIKDSGENAAAVVQDLMTLSRKGVATYELLNLNEIVERCVAAQEIRALLRHQPKIRIEVHLEPDLLYIYGSSAHICKSFSNLLLNAIEAMPEGGHIEILTKNRYADKLVSGFDAVREGEYAVLSISDTGVGISENDQARIFEPFYTRKVMGRSGSGLGMAVVWGTVKDHKGYIDLQSTIGDGTKFELFFPATRDRLKTDNAQQEQIQIFGNGERILVVDDMPAQREIATGILDRLGYHSRAVCSGEEAVGFLREHDVDLVVLDMIMDPGIDGYETLRRIKAMRPMQKTIIASGYSETDRVKKAQKLGAAGYIKKPYTLEAFGKAIQEELHKLDA